MKKSLFSKILTLVFVASITIPVSVTIQSCSKKPRYQKPRNGGKRINSSGKVGSRKDKNRHVWGK